MRLDDLDYELPESLIAQEPLAERDASRLMLVDVGTATIEHHRFTDLPSLLPSSLFVFNDTRVFPARLHGHKTTGGKVELLLLSKTDATRHRWLALGRASKPIRPDTDLVFRGGVLRARVRRVHGEGELEVELRADGDLDALIEEVGEVPLPPYIRRPASDADRARYQTIYARKTGAVAAPTAGLHFTRPLLDTLVALGHELAYVTLHVGAGTFRPVQVEELDDHRMHEEVYEVSDTTVDALERARRERRPIAAVGTTVVRTLESALDAEDAPTVGHGRSDLFIKPPYRFRIVDHLITNFHLPRSTLLALVMSMAGSDLVRRAYREAIDERYRFYSYGDAMLIRGGRP